jgi:ubiquinone/menaquinone biosynthesis C-methylase UbiE
MWWIIGLALSGIAIAAAVMIGNRRMNIPREPDRECPQDDAAFEAYRRTSSWPVFVLERYITLEALSKLKPRGRLVDAGCGPGFLAAKITQKYPELNVIGLDINETAIKMAQKAWKSNQNDNLELLNGDVQRMPFANDSLDLVVSSLSLHHWPDAQKAFREIRRVLKPGGRFLIFDLRRDGPAGFYWALKLGQALVAPPDIRRTNGAVGSFWAAYRPSEIKTMLMDIQLEKVIIKSQLAWMIIQGSKTRRD